MLVEQVGEELGDLILGTNLVSSMKSLASAVQRREYEGRRDGSGPVQHKPKQKQNSNLTTQISSVTTMQMLLRIHSALKLSKVEE